MESNSIKRTWNRPSTWVGLVGAFVLALIGFLIGLAIYMHSGAHAASVLAGHLKQKYHEDFVVTNAEYVNAGLGVDGVWKAVARPKSNASREFNIGSSKNLDSFSDQYVAALWEKGETPQLQAKTTELFRGAVQPTSTLEIFLSGDATKTLTTTSTPEASIHTYPEFVLYKISLDIRDVDEAAITDYNSRVMSLLQPYATKGVKSLWLDKYTLETTTGKKYECIERWSNSAQDIQTFNIDSCLKLKENQPHPTNSRGNTLK